MGGWCVNFSNVVLYTFLTTISIYIIIIEHSVYIYEKRTKLYLWTTVMFSEFFTIGTFWIWNTFWIRIITFESEFDTVVPQIWIWRQKGHKIVR